MTQAMTMRETLQEFLLKLPATVPDFHYIEGHGDEAWHLSVVWPRVSIHFHFSWTTMLRDGTMVEYFRNIDDLLVRLLEVL